MAVDIQLKKDFEGNFGQFIFFVGGGRMLDTQAVEKRGSLVDMSSLV